MKKIIRPTEFKGKDKVTYLNLLIWAILFMLGIYIDNFTISILSCLLAIQIFVIFGTIDLVNRYSVTIKIEDDNIVLKDGLTDKKFISIEQSQSINISEIKYIYLIDEEYQDNIDFEEYCEGVEVDREVFLNIEKELEKLTRKIFYRRFVSLQKVTQAISSLYYVAEIYAIPKSEIENIRKCLFENAEFDFKSIFKMYGVNKEYIKLVEDALSEFKSKVPLKVTLNSKIQIKKYLELKPEDSKIGSLKKGIVLTNIDGNSKIYINNFYHISAENRLILVNHINSKNSEIIYSMSNEEKEKLIK